MLRLPLDPSRVAQRIATNLNGHLSAAKANYDHGTMGGRAGQHRYPINNVADLRHAHQAIGRTRPSERAAVRRHMEEEARRLGLTTFLEHLDSHETKGY